eukprot:TRINITY_DN5597_c0_g1_i3.p1 TRINITY_DN5597_c0_g1~~TRINITY_DN5597_c0_g1_i3.p1  ORF type:complete len:435 (+),score=122.21 TRINITY_DN5597_c0_g1_i3:44-1348(+)
MSQLLDGRGTLPEGFHEVSHEFVGKALFPMVYSFLGNVTDYLTGLRVCKSFNRELSQPRCAKYVKGFSLSRIAPKRWCQRLVERIAMKFPGLTSLSISCEYDDNLTHVVFENVAFPELERLELYCAPLVSFNFNQKNTPKLASLSLSNQGPYAAEQINLDLPFLRNLSIEYCEVGDTSGFSQSIENCPNLEMLGCYKFWGLSSVPVHRLNLPKCTSFGLYRSDDLRGLDILSAPVLEYLNLRACYGLERVRLPDQTEIGPPITVELTNANIDSDSMRHLRGHSRVGKIIEPDAEDESGFDYSGLAEEYEEGDEDELDVGDDGHGPGCGCHHGGGIVDGVGAVIPSLVTAEDLRNAEMMLEILERSGNALGGDRAQAVEFMSQMLVFERLRDSGGLGQVFGFAGDDDEEQEEDEDYEGFEEEEQDEEEEEYEEVN